MSQKLQNQLKEVGSKLDNLPPSKDALIKLLKQAAACLSELDQSPLPSMLESLQPFLNAIVKPEFLKHQDRDVKLLVAACICEITRITAPEAPYSDDVLRDIFRLVVDTFSGLADLNGPSFGRRVIILETLARYRSCVVMLDLECDDLVNQMFVTFFAVASDDHPESVLTSMKTIMILLIEESEDIQENRLVTLLSVLGRGKSDVPMAARKLAMNVIQHCAGKLESCIKQLLMSSMTGDSNSLTSQFDYHEVIFDIFRCAPEILSGVIPYLTGELLADQLDTRLKAVKLLGDLFALPDCAISDTFQSVFSEFLKRLTDRAVEVRMSVVEHVKRCLLSNPFRPESSQILSVLCDRLLDFDENVRKEVVAAVCHVACSTLKSIPVETLRLVTERLRDKSLIVKRYTLERTAEIYRHYCLKSADGSISSSEFEWIPGKILRCFYDKDLRAETIEVVLCGSLFPKEFSDKDKVKHWVLVFSGLEKVEVKALEKILEQKQKLQQEMQKYLSLRQMMHQDCDAPEVQKKMLLSFRLMSRWFIDPAKAEENFQILDQLKDSNVWKILSKLLDPNTSFQQASTYRDDLLKILGEKHPLYEFLGTLSSKCSYLLFNKECVKEVLLEVTTQKSAGTGHRQHIQSCMSLLVILARFSPSLFNGTEEDLVRFLTEDHEIIKEGTLHILANAGGTIREQLALTSSSVDLILERLCLEGRRKQAKYAVHALAAITKDDGLKSLSVLYKRLVDTLADKAHLPARLQSLGCIAQTAMPIFETRESEVVGFITNSILQCSNKAEDDIKTNWNDRSELCLLKIYSLKTLMKSYLPVKDAHLRHGIENFLDILKNIFLTGEVSAHVKSSPVDKAHMKLASAKAILRLSKHWDHKIPIDIFHLVVRTAEISYPQVKKQFLGKVTQYIKDRLLDLKYACAFLFGKPGSRRREFEEEKHNLIEVIQMCDQAKSRQLPILCDANPLMTYPEYMLPYLVHALAHHSSCPNVEECADVKAFEPMYRQLHCCLSVLVHGDDDGKLEVNSRGKERITTIISILQSIKSSEDVLDVKKSKNSYAACDIGLSITKNLAKKQEDLTGSTPVVPLPSAIYRPLERKDGVVDTVGDEPNSWLEGAGVLAHLENLMLGSNGTVAEGEVMEDSDIDGNDVPLGQMLKTIKAQGTKRKKDGKKNLGPSETKNPEKDDILGMVREINLNNLDRSKHLESGNGHGYSSSGNIDDQSNDEKILVSRKRKRRKTGDVPSIGVPKRKRSAPAQNVQKSSRAWNYSENLKKTSRGYSRGAEFPSSQSADEKEAHADSTDGMSMEKETAEPLETDLLASCLPTNKNSSSKPKYKGIDQSSNLEHTGEGGVTDPKMLIVQPIKSTMGPIKKRKRRSIAVLAKCSSKEGDEHRLVGCRIKVWWPLDKQFYEGLVQSYDPGKKKHEILYYDGDMEVLDLEKERWELIVDGSSPKKRQKSLNVTPIKSMLPEQKKNNRRTPSSSRRNRKSKKSSSSRVRRNGTSKGSSGQRKSDDIEDNIDSFSDVESRGASDLSNREPVLASKADATNSGTKGKQVENAGVSGTDVQESDKDDKHVSDETEKSEPDVAEPLKEEQLADDADEDKSDFEPEEEEKSVSSHSRVVSEDSDDEPLGVWKLRAAAKGKGAAKRKAAM